MNKEMNKPQTSESSHPAQSQCPIFDKLINNTQITLTAVLKVLSVIAAIGGIMLIFMLLTLEIYVDVPEIVSVIPPVNISAKLPYDSPECTPEIPSSLLNGEATHFQFVDELLLYNFANPVPECDPVEYDYFSDTVFIGDSRTQGLIMYSQITPYNFAAQGGNINSIQAKKYIVLKDENGVNRNYTLFEALEKENGNYKAIYISTGVNELGWTESSFIDKYSALVDRIREITDVPIYIQLIMPVTVEYAESSLIKNEAAASFNESLRLLASDKSLFLLDPTFLHTLDDGTLDPSHSYDGAHLWPESYVELAEYYRTHVVDIYAYHNTTPQKYQQEEISDEITDIP